MEWEGKGKGGCGWGVGWKEVGWRKWGDDPLVFVVVIVKIAFVMLLLGRVELVVVVVMMMMGMIGWFFGQEKGVRGLR